VTQRSWLLVGGNAVLVLVVLAVMLRSSGLATAPVSALGQLPNGRLMVPRTAPDGDFVKQLEGGRITWHGTYGNVVDNMIWYFDLYERAECLLSKELLAIQPGGYLDVGANFGNHSLFLSSFATEVHAIEPFPPALVQMRKNVDANEGSNVSVHAVGYGNENGVLPFYPPPDGSFVVGTFDEGFAMGDGDVIELPVVIGDEHLADVGAGRFGLVKVDIEGFERFALEGLRETLVAQRPIVMFELNLTDGGFRSLESLNATFPENYEYWEVDLDPEWQVNLGFAIWYYGSEATGHYELRPLGELRRLNALAVPAEHAAAVRELAGR